MPRRSTRREFLKVSAAGAGLFLGLRGAPAIGRPGGGGEEKLRLGVIGVGGRGAGNLDDVKGEEVVALCDVDQVRLYEASQACPHARLYGDFRRVLDLKEVEAVVVSTPDHTHAPITVLALKAGKHVYCEKPLTHTVREAQVVASTAVATRRATQMGTQIHAESNYRRVVELVRSGAIGPVTECHVWVEKTWSGGERPVETPPAPPHLRYDLWLGPAAERPYHPAYLPANWRRWWVFGGGTLADMGCHYLDLVHWALDLWSPSAVEAEGPPVHAETTPPWLRVRFEHSARGKLPPVKVTWYDGGERPPHFAEGKLPRWGDGVLFVGEKGMLLADYGRWKLLPEDRYQGFQPPPPSIADSIGHHLEWIQACRTGAPTTCNFAYGAALTETVLLGNVAYRAGTRIEWDRWGMRVRNHPAANAYLTKQYRPGWQVEGA